MEGGGRRRQAAWREGASARAGGGSRWASSKTPLLAAPARRCAPAQLQLLSVRLHFQHRPQHRQRLTDASLSPALPLIGTSEQPAQRARRTCRRPRIAAPSLAEGRKYPVERAVTVRDGQKKKKKKSPKSTKILTNKGKMLYYLQSAFTSTVAWRLPNNLVRDVLLRYIFSYSVTLSKLLNLSVPQLSHGEEWR